MRFSMAWLGMSITLVTTTVLSAQTVTSDSYVRYTTPGQCEQAAIRLQKQYWRDKRPDTVVYAPATDSVPAVALQGARACGAKFTVATVPERELLNLAQLYLLEKQDDLAKAAISRLLAGPSQTNPVTRGWTLYLWSGSLLNAKPTRMAMAKEYLAQLDALGSPAATWQLFAHSGFADYALSINDISGAAVESNAALAAGAQMSQNDRIDWVFSLVHAYSNLANVVSLQKGGPAALAVMDTALAVLTPLRPAGSNELQMLQTSISLMRQPYTLFGAKAQPLQGAHWYGTKGDSVFPKAGVVSLIMFVNHSCGGFCYPAYATLRRLHDKYASRGLQMIFLGSTSGYFRNHLQTPPAEADSAGRYFLDFLKLPGVVSMSETAFSKRADGRRMNAATVNLKNYYRSRSTILVDKQGIIRLTTSASPQREATLDSAIDAALR